MAVATAADLPGFIAEADGSTLAAVTYRMSADECEVVTLNSLESGRGVGTALLERVKKLADEHQSRLWLITTNDNDNAIRFYQRRGMDLHAIHRDFVEEVRRWKPDLDDNAWGIRFRHAVEFTY